MNVYGVLVTFNRPGDLAGTLTAIDSQSMSPDRLIIVDNGEPGPTRELLQRSRMAVEHIVTGDNLGPAGGIEVGQQRVLELAEAGDWIVIFDDDNPPWAATQLEDLRAAATAVEGSGRRVGAVGSSGSRLNKHGRLSRMPMGTGEALMSADYLGSGNFPHYSIDAIREVGLFDGRLFFGFDDLEYGLRLTSNHWELLAVADHIAAARKRWPVDSRLYQTPPAWRRYYATRNGVWILWRYGYRFGAIAFSTRATASGISRSLRSGSVAPLVLELRALRDAFRSRLGRTVDPRAKLPAPPTA